MIKLFKDGPWRQPEKINEPLAGCVEAVVAIVGAGVTGLSTALELTERGLGVVVLEQKWVGFGASGTNAGQQASAINEQLLMMSRFVGESAIREYVALLNQALAYMTDYIGRYEIDCGHHKTGSLVAIAMQSGRDVIHRKGTRQGNGIGGARSLCGRGRNARARPAGGLQLRDVGRWRYLSTLSVRQWNSQGRRTEGGAPL